jgi:hypothetical protein
MIRVRWFIAAGLGLLPVIWIVVAQPRPHWRIDRGAWWFRWSTVLLQSTRIRPPMRIAGRAGVGVQVCGGAWCRCAASGRRGREPVRTAGSLGSAARREARIVLTAAGAAVPQPRRNRIDALLDGAGHGRVPPSQALDARDARTFRDISAERCRPAFARGFAFVSHRARGRPHPP